MSNQTYNPKPVFDTIEELIEQYKDIHGSDNPQQIIRKWLNLCFKNLDIGIPQYVFKDYQTAVNFLIFRNFKPDFCAIFGLKKRCIKKQMGFFE